MGDFVALSLAASFILGIIAFFAMMKIFTIANQLELLNKNFNNFSKYYADLQAYNQSKEK